MLIITCLPRFLSQNWQSAAPPAIVPSKKGLISMTFLTVCEAAGEHEAKEGLENAGQPQPDDN
jgi:hypothetical protein